MKKQVLLFAAIVLIAVNASAQTFIGKVIDELSEPLAYATVQILNPSDSTNVNVVITDDNGIFSIDAAKTQPYAVHISYLGYKPFAGTRTPGDTWQPHRNK